MSDNEDYSMGDGINDFVNTIVKNNGGWAIPNTFLENVEAFYEAITWRDDFIIIILIIHLIFLILIIITRKIWQAQLSLLITCAILTMSAEYINIYGNKNWKLLHVSQNYFDEQGIFIGVIYCAPLLFLSFIIVIQNVYYASSLLIDVKTKQFKLQQKKKQ